MREMQKFKFVCDVCGSLTIRIADPEHAQDAEIVECGRCNSPRGTMAALRQLASQGTSDFFES
jgi:hypothetical protein